MRIVHVYKDYFPVLGGIENHIRQLAEAQAKRGHDVDVLVTNLDATYASETLNGVRVTKAPRHLNVQSAPIGFSFRAAVERLTTGADIVHLHAPYPIGETCNLISGRARKTVITWHSDIVRQKTLLRFYAPILRRAIAKADAIIPTSEVYARTSPWLRDHLDKCRPVPLGVDAHRFQIPSSKLDDATPRSTQNLKPSNLTLLSVGRLRYYKGLDRLIRIMPRLRNVTATIVGAGPMEAEWKALTQQLSVADRVTFAGEVSDTDLPMCYQAADAYVIPATSRAEAFGIAILEAMASGLPVISTDVGTATSWINQNGVTGFVVPPDEDDALVAAIEKLRDAALRQRMGRAARTRVEAEFTVQRMVEQIEHVYLDVLNAPRSRVGP
jgi:rhamnosyl/mannosyltransferase